jgi:DNA-directed RNA polymerase subunit alpha|tara:strand:- start:375 stop:656 length:282 start_codon:yes stop_codon:yes gene_type:complete
MDYLVKKIDTLSLRKRLITALKNDQIIYVGDLLNRSEIDLLKCPYVGPKSVEEIKRVLNTLNLNLATGVDHKRGEGNANSDGKKVRWAIASSR